MQNLEPHTSTLPLVVEKIYFNNFCLRNFAFARKTYCKSIAFFQETLRSLLKDNLRSLAKRLHLCLLAKYLHSLAKRFLEKSTEMFLKWFLLPIPSFLGPFKSFPRECKSIEIWFSLLSHFFYYHHVSLRAPYSWNGNALCLFPVFLLTVYFLFITVVMAYQLQTLEVSVQLSRNVNERCWQHLLNTTSVSKVSSV